MAHPWAKLMLLVLTLSACGGGTTGSTPVSTQPVVVARPVRLEPSAGVGRNQPPEQAPVAELSAGLNNAGFDLWQSQPVEGNLVFGPASIGHALLMARAAADDETGAAIDEAFELPVGLSAHQGWNALDQMIRAADDSEDEVTVTFADRIWLRLDREPDQAWLDLLVSEHGATTETLDFAANPAGSREAINAWVGEQTEGLIPELLPDGLITPQTVLVLTDAVYFKARWEREFGKYGSVTDVFTRHDGSNTEVEFMRELDLTDRRGAGDGFVGAEIPYVGGEFSMLVLVPDEGRFDQVRNRLDQDLLYEIDLTFTSGPFELLIPRWADKSSIDLLTWLQDIGAAPGSYPAISDDAFLDAAVHAANINVDEWGTVAAAATSLGFATSGPPEPELTVKADRPFLYLIRHRPSGIVLFAGQVTDPTT